MNAEPGVPFRHAARQLIERGQASIAAAIGVNAQKREETVLIMHDNISRRAPGYWIQLFLATGIATLGLVLGSTAVVIGAMLVSPLMGPLLELGMGFAVGSSLLVIRAFLRVALSIGIVIAGAALLTLGLPFHEVTSEIASRTAPTALDLLVAIFCALTAAYTTVRPGADSTAAAAGTAIGIALVPPLCTIGFGLGTGSIAIAGGAALLFTANLSAILVFAVLSFLLLGFNQVDAVSVESGYLTENDTRTDRVAARAHRLLSRGFGSPYGIAMRILIPGIFLAGVYVPLRHALAEVTWEVHTRDAIRRIVAAESPKSVQSSVVVEHHTISLRLLVVGSSERAASLESILTSRIAETSGVTPTVSVVPVADSRALAATANAEARPAEQTVALAMSEMTRHVAAALADAWPAAAGRLAGWDVSLAPNASPAIVVRHVGPSLGAPGAALLAAALTSRLGISVRINDARIPEQPIVPSAGRESVWLDSALALVQSASATDSVVVCLTAPVIKPDARSADGRILARLVTAGDTARGRVHVVAKGPWSVHPEFGACAQAASPPATK